MKPRSQPLNRRQPLARKSGLSRTSPLLNRSVPSDPSRIRDGAKQRQPMKRSQPDRDWRDARQKIDGTYCRLCTEDNPNVEAAHVIGRENDRPKPCEGCHGTGGDAFDGGESGSMVCWSCEGLGSQKPDVLWVNPDSVIPLCRPHHTAYDHHEIDVLPVLTFEEQVQAVKDAGGLENARVRTCPTAYRKAAA